MGEIHFYFVLSCNTISPHIVLPYCLGREVKMKWLRYSSIQHVQKDRGQLWEVRGGEEQGEGRRAERRIHKSNWNMRKCFMEVSMIEYTFKSLIDVHCTIRKSKKHFRPEASFWKCVWTTMQIIKTFSAFIIWMIHWTIEWFTH